MQDDFEIVVEVVPPFQCTVRLEREDRVVEAVVDEPSIEIFVGRVGARDHRLAFAGRGRVALRAGAVVIEDCSANLGDDLFSALEARLSEEAVA